MTIGYFKIIGKINCITYVYFFTYILFMSIYSYLKGVDNKEQLILFELYSMKKDY